MWLEIPLSTTLVVIHLINSSFYHLFLLFSLFISEFVFPIFAKIVYQKVVFEIRAINIKQTIQFFPMHTSYPKVLKMQFTLKVNFGIYCVNIRLWSSDYLGTFVVQVILFEIDYAIFYTNLPELFCQFISWTNWVNSGKFIDKCSISCQVMADMENLYDDLITINLYVPTSKSAQSWKSWIF